MSFRDEDLTRDAFLDGRLTLLQPRAGYRAATDPVFLAAFVPARPGERVLDLGCGAGAAGLCLARRVPGLDLHGLEFQPAYAALARRNADLNGLAMTVHEGDVRRPPPALRALVFDHVLANPPYHAAGAATAARDAGRDRAHREGEATLDDWIACGLRRLRPGGWISVIHRSERLGALLRALEPGAGGIEIRPVAARADRPATRVLVRGRKGSRKSLAVLHPLTVHAANSHIGDGNDYDQEANEVLRGMAQLLPDARSGGNTV